MSIAVLAQVSDELRRLAIAGSAVAPGDFRLKKLSPSLAKAGEKAPVFAKVAGVVDTLVGSDERSSAPALLDASTLVNAVLYTQGSTGIEGELQPLETRDLGFTRTRSSAQLLKPLLEALRTTGGGRMEIIEDGFNRGMFRDLRLILPAVEAIDDPYPDIGNFIVNRVLPLYGAAIVPPVRSSFDPKGKGGHVRRLQLMHALDPVGTRPIVQAALDDGSKEVRVAAIECLGDSPEDLPILLEQVKAKAKAVRQAAYVGLAKCDDPQAVQALKKGMNGGDFEIAVWPIGKSHVRALRGFILDKLRETVANLLSKKNDDKKQNRIHIMRGISMLCALPERTDAETDAVLQEMFEQRDELSKAKGDANVSGNGLVCHLLKAMAEGSEPLQKLLISQHATLPADQLGMALDAALKTLPPKQVYDEFSPYLTAAAKSKKDAAGQKREAVISGLQQVSVSGWSYFGGARTKAGLELDPRWLDLAVEQQHEDLTMSLARPGHVGSQRLLEEAFEKFSKSGTAMHRVAMPLATMVQTQHPKATDAVIQILEKCAATKTRQYELYWVIPLVAHLPAASAPRIEALLPSFSDRTADQLANALHELKMKQTHPSST